MDEGKKSFPFKILEGGRENEKNLEKNTLKALAFMAVIEKEAKLNQSKSKRLTELYFELQNLLLEIKTEIKKLKLLKSFDQIDLESGRKELETNRASEFPPPTSAQNLALELEMSAGSKYKKLAELVSLFNTSQKEFNDVKTQWASQERQNKS